MKTTYLWHFTCKYHHGGFLYVEWFSVSSTFENGKTTYHKHFYANLGSMKSEITSHEFGNLRRIWTEKIGQRHKKYLGTWQGNLCVEKDDGSRKLKRQRYELTTA